jgi:hypothetical protein
MRLRARDSGTGLACMLELLTLNQRVQGSSPCAPTNHSSLSRDFLGLRQKPPIARCPRGRFVSECSGIPLMPPF